MKKNLKGLQTNYLGKNFYFFDNIDSTQTEIWRRIDNKKIKNGTIIMADIQTKGKGTHGRIWHTDEKNNIAFSMYIETNDVVELFEGITKEIAKTIQEILKSKYKINVEIKYPNDLMIKGKKVGGILTESRVKSDLIKYIVIGIGINTNKSEFPEDIKEIATSIKQEYKINIDKYEFVSEFCNKFEEKLNERIKKYENRFLISRSRISKSWNG